MKDINVLNCAMKVFSKLDRSRHHVDWISYQWLLEVGLKVLSEEKYNTKRLDFLKNVTRKCCENGLLAREVVRAISNGPVFVDGWTKNMCNQAVKTVLGEWPLPKSWSRNLKNHNLSPTREDLNRENKEIFGRGRKKKNRNFKYRYPESYY